MKIVWYGLIIAAVAALTKLAEFRFTVTDEDTEVYGGIVALIFTAAGIILGLRIGRKKTEPNETAAEAVSSPGGDSEVIAQYNLSRRELEILNLMAHGMSNKEISDAVFLSVNTVKTHVSNIFEKLEAKRRTEAIKKARELQIIH